jgi:hypothetical protein
LPWDRAAAITLQLCEFLEEADRFETDSTSRRVLLHNDLKPRNIRVIDGDGIKVLDFGAAKALSLSRKVTRNDFGSTAYLSPECLESGDRDRHSDAWALGVLLYEMVRGRQPFRADDTRRLEQLIRARQQPESLDGCCPPALEALIAKLLAPYPADRYATPADIRADLARALAGEPTAALAEGWPEAPSRRLAHHEPPTRRTPRDQDAVEPPTRRTQAPDGVPAGPPAVPAVPPPIAARPRYRVRRLVRSAGLVVVAGLLLNDGCVGAKANRLASTVPLQDFQGLTTLWPQYEALAASSVMGVAVDGLERALTAQTMVLAERVMANYRTPFPTVRENQWRAARDALSRAVALAPRDSGLRASLRYCDGHLNRINGEANKARKQATVAQREFTDAVVAFREAAALRPNWPDPFLGLARTFIYGLEDVDRGAQALTEAEKLGHRPGEREATQLADGYRARGETLARTAQTLRDMPQEHDYLSRAKEAYNEALTRYSAITGVGSTAVSIRDTQRRLDRVEQRLDELSRRDRAWPWD